MGTLRSETYYAGGYVIHQLRQSGMLATMLHDGGDIILFTLYSGETVSIHLIESGIPLYEIRSILHDNADKGYYTLFMLWRSMMLPDHGQRFQVEDWTEALYTLYGGSIYGYDVIDNIVYVFPAYFRGSGTQRLVEYGDTIAADQLVCRVVKTSILGFSGEWYVADFAVEQDAAQARVGVVRAAGIERYYAVLGVELGADREAVRMAYRELARRYHPDTNVEPDANEQMQRINDAYDKILRNFDGG